MEDIGPTDTHVVMLEMTSQDTPTEFTDIGNDERSSEFRPSDEVR